MKWHRITCSRIPLSFIRFISIQEKGLTWDMAVQSHWSAVSRLSASLQHSPFKILSTFGGSKSSLFQSISFFLQFLISFCKLEPFQGYSCMIKWQILTPRAQASLCKEYTLLQRDSKGMKTGLPTRYDSFTWLSPSGSILANPKSPIFHTPSFRKMLAGLISLCRTLILARYAHPSPTCLTTSPQGRSCPCFAHYSSVPPSQNSVMRQQLLLVQCKSTKPRICGWSSCCRMWTSFSSSRSWAEGVFLREMTLMAKLVCFSLSRMPLQTLLLQPAPILSFRQKLYRPTRFLPL